MIELSQSAIRQTESDGLADLKNGNVLYGFTAQSDSTLLLARWGDNGIVFYRGKALPAKDFTTVFSHEPRN